MFHESGKEKHVLKDKESLQQGMLLVESFILMATC